MLLALNVNSSKIKCKIIYFHFSLERAIKFQHVQQLHDELESGLKKWQKQVLTFQWESAERAEHKVTRQLESKRFKVESENRARQHHHYKLMERYIRM